MRIIGILYYYIHILYYIIYINFQLECGGLNGRPMKKEDVCYSWWVLSALNTIGKSNWIDSEKLKSFILATQVQTIHKKTVRNVTLGY